MSLTDYPERIYQVFQEGELVCKVRADYLDPEKAAKCRFGMPYMEYRMLEYPSDKPWTSNDYEERIKNAKTLTCYTEMDLEFINEVLEGRSVHQYHNIYTLDLDEAVRISKERWDRFHPVGKAYDVVSYFDDCDPHIMNSEPLLYSEALQLKAKYNSARKHLMSYEIKVHR